METENKFNEQKTDIDARQIASQIIVQNGLSNEDSDTNDVSSGAASPDATPYVINYKNANVKAKKKRSPFGTEGGIFAFLLIFGIALVLSIFTFQVWLTPIQVVGKSMQPTINVSVTSEEDTDHSDIVYFAKASSYKVGDIVIVDNTSSKYIDVTILPGYENEENPDYLIKRVVATGGQTIRFYITNTLYSFSKITYYYQIVVLDSNGVDINLDQSYLSEEMQFSSDELKAYSIYYPVYAEIFNGMKNDTDGIYEYQVKQNHYFVMGDNRNNSTDSRYFGEVAYEDISGSVRLIVAYGKNIFTAILYKIRYGNY